MKKTYLTRKTFAKFDDEQFIVYLNEEVVENYVPENEGEGESVNPVTAYSYDGPMEDGGTLVKCQSATRDELINGLIRIGYSQTQEDAVKTHQIQLLLDPDTPKAKDYAVEWEEFNGYREKCINTVDQWLE